MKVFHGSLDIVDVPMILDPNRTLDYGVGFYTTTNYEQAENWVKRKKNGLAQYGYVNIYEINKEDILSKKVLWFDYPTEEWVDFVYSNRNDIHFKHDYDYVYGPVANDRVYAAFALYEANILNKHELIQELKTYALVDQLLFHTEASLNVLKYVESIKIEL